MLKQGDQGKEVRELQESLLKLGYELPKFGADGDFGSETVSAVTSFKQELVDLPACANGRQGRIQKKIRFFS